jgi:CRISPR-associated protein Csd1
MALEPNKQDRSYQFGRLLAVLEKAERDTYQKDETREPNAIRRLSVFTQRPMETFNQLCTHIKTAYLPRLSPASRAFYEKLIGEIVEQLSQITDEPLNASLEDTYLFGYYLQRNELYKSKKEKEKEEG